MTVDVVVGVVAGQAYIGVAAVVGGKTRRMLTCNCANFCTHLHGLTAIAIGVSWPVSWAAVLGYVIARRPTAEQKEAKAEATKRATAATIARLEREHDLARQREIDKATDEAGRQDEASAAKRAMLVARDRAYKAARCRYDHYR